MKPPVGEDKALQETADEALQTSCKQKVLGGVSPRIREGGSSTYLWGKTWGYKGVIRTCYQTARAQRQDGDFAHFLSSNVKEAKLCSQKVRESQHDLKTNKIEI